MISVFKKKNKILTWFLLITNLLIILLSLIFFDFYKTRKVSQYNKLNDTKNKEIQNIEKDLSDYYHKFDKFIFQQKDREILKSKNNKKYELNKINTNLYFSKTEGRSTAYLENYKNNLILTTATGLFFKIKEEDLNKKKITPIKIESNIFNFFKNKKFFLKSWYSIKDILIDDENIFVSFNNEVRDGCFNTGVLKAKINENYLHFEKFFDHKECKSLANSKYKTFSVGQAGGRLIKYKEKYLLTHGSYSEFDEVQDDYSIFGKILLIDKFGKLNKIFSKGHRNPQGLALFKKKIIFETEHGPNGGDEINIIKENYNYGWPIASYGKHYQGQKHINKFYPLPNSHNLFEEPLKYFEQSIAISQIIDVPKFFDNSSDNSIFLSSMKINKFFGEKINLFQYKLINNKLFLKDIIPIGERIRDIIYNEKRNEIIMFLDTSASIGILSVN